MSDAVAPLGGRTRVFFLDEARLGQQGTLTRAWAPRGSRPAAVKQTRYEWAYLYAAVEPATGGSVALLAPNVDAGTLSVFLRMLAAEAKPGERVVLIMDRAGWHRSKALRLPDRVTVLPPPPPYSPELNPPRREPVAPPAEPPPEQPRVRRLRPPARRGHGGVASADAGGAQVRLRLPVPRARESVMIRIRARPQDAP